MINLSICPNRYYRSAGVHTDHLVAMLSSVVSMPASDDLSGGKVKDAISSNTPLYVTSDQYTVPSCWFPHINVMVGRQDYRVIIGNGEKAVKVEPLDARAARAQTRMDAALFEKKMQGPPPPGTANPRVDRVPGSQDGYDYISFDSPKPPGAGDYSQLPSAPSGYGYVDLPKRPRSGNYAAFPPGPNR